MIPKSATLDSVFSAYVTGKRINKFDPELVAMHKHAAHDIPPIPKNFTLYDAIEYIYGDDVPAQADLMQSYLDDVENTHDLIDTLSLGIAEGFVCLKCVKNTVKKNTTDSE